MTFTVNPRADFVAAMEAAVSATTKSLVQEITDSGSALVLNDAAFTALYDQGFFPNGTTWGAAAPASPTENDLWYDNVNHVLMYYDIILGAWQTPNVVRLNEILTRTFSSNRTYLVPTHWATPLDVANFLANYTVPNGLKITVDIAAGTYNHAGAMFGHADGLRILYTGSTAGYNGAVPVIGDLVTTGNTSATVAADKATNIATLQSKYKVIINCTGLGIGLNGPDRTLVMSDVLFVGPGSSFGIYATNGAVGLIGGVSAVNFATGVAAFNNGSIGETTSTGSLNCFVGNTAFGIYCVDRGLFGGLTKHWVAMNCGSAANNYGALVQYGSVARFLGGFSAISNIGSGIIATGGSSVTYSNLTAKNNTVNGVYSQNCSSVNRSAGSTTLTGNAAGGALAELNSSITLTAPAAISNNGANGIHAHAGSSIVAFGATVSNNGARGIYAYHASTVVANASTVQGNVGEGVYAGYESQIGISPSTISGNGGLADVYAGINSNIGTGAIGAATASPAINTVGNNNSYIQG